VPIPLEVEAPIASSAADEEESASAEEETAFIDF
jgi:hypothetical protein